nr:hypothetical protein [Mycolicibacterium komanii]CRL66616.1 hypothetical protein CPGR_00152 [Mycolicibacterium komanii]
MTARLDRTPKPCELSEVDFDTIAWGFLGSEFTGLIYADWPIERRVDAYLAHRGMTSLLNDGDADVAIVQHVLANIGAAMRDGTLATATWETVRRNRATQESRREFTAPDRHAVRVASGTVIRSERYG